MKARSKRWKEPRIVESDPVDISDAERADIVEACKEADAGIAAWLAEHPNALRDLIVTYNDTDAADFLTALREDFWS